MTAASAQAAVDNANRYTAYSTGMCLQFVRGPCWEVAAVAGSAIEAWNMARHKHPGDRNPPLGAPCFYRGGQYGHIVIRKAPTIGMRSTDCKSSGKVGDADLSWPETNWGQDYLGWSEDLNGVRLPLKLDGDDGEDDDMPQYDHATRSSPQAVDESWTSIPWDDVSSGDAFDAGATGATIGGRRYTAVLHVTVDAPAGATIRMRCSEWDHGERQEANPQTEMEATGGGTYATHVQIGAVKDGRALRFELASTQPATLQHADACVLSWG